MIRRIFGPKDDEFDKIPEMKLPSKETKFHYDAKRGRYVFEGEDNDEIDCKAKLPPPKMEKKPEGGPKLSKQDPKKMNVTKRYASVFPGASETDDPKPDPKPEEVPDTKESMITDRSLPQSAAPIEINEWPQDIKNIEEILTQERLKIENEFNKKYMSLSKLLTSKDNFISNCIEEKNDIVDKYEREVKYLREKLKESVSQNIKSKLSIQKIKVNIKLIYYRKTSNTLMMKIVDLITCLTATRQV